MTTKEQHVAYTYERYITTDPQLEHVHTEEVAVYCGDWREGARVLCDKHYAEEAKRYPQGWRHYPGDVCKHGMYVGGCGIDWICQLCEDGD